MWSIFHRREEPAPATPDKSEAARRLDEVCAGADVRLTSTIADMQMVGQVAVATVTTTELSAEKGVEHLAELLLELDGTAAKHFVLDIQNVQYMDSACLGCLVEALNRLASHGGRIALVKPVDRVQYLFKLTRLDRVFKICPDVPAAMEAVEGAPTVQGRLGIMPGPHA